MSHDAGRDLRYLSFVAREATIGMVIPAGDPVNDDRPPSPGGDGGRSKERRNGLPAPQVRQTPEATGVGEHGCD